MNTNQFYRAFGVNVEVNPNYYINSARFGEGPNAPQSAILLAGFTLTVISVPFISAAIAAALGPLDTKTNFNTGSFAYDAMTNGIAAFTIMAGIEMAFFGIPTAIKLYNDPSQTLHNLGETGKMLIDCFHFSGDYLYANVADIIGTYDA